MVIMVKVYRNLRNLFLIHARAGWFSAEAGEGWGGKGTNES